MTRGELEMDLCEVKLYALSTCIHCRNAKEFLTDSGITYKCIDVDTLGVEERKEVLDEIRRVNSSCSFPTIVIGDSVIVGFKEDEIKRALGL